jgi:hypothetical protein
VTWWQIYILYSQFSIWTGLKEYKWCSLTQSVLSGLDNQGEFPVHVLLGLLLCYSAHSTLLL